jgi:hypothetical protein
MASEKQIAANRRNALHSTGPSTPETKAKTRLNAMRDGLTGQVTTLSDEDRPVFEALKAELIKDLAPKTVMELRLASAIAWDTWRLDHLRAIETGIFALGIDDDDVIVDCDDPQLHTSIADAVTFRKQSNKFGLMSLYEQRMNRNLHKNLATLRELQAERRSNEARALKEEVRLACANDINGLPYEAPTRPNQNGIVFSTPTVLAAAHRHTSLQVARKAVWLAPYKVRFAGASSGSTLDSPANVEKWPVEDAA